MPAPSAAPVAPAARPTVSTFPELNPAMGFAEAGEAVVAFLETAIPMGHWAVTRYDGTDQIHLAVRDRAYGMAAGSSNPWSGSFCQYATAGVAPQIAPDVDAVPEYVAIRAAAGLDIGSYVGVPINLADGKLFGTLCGFDPETRNGSFGEHGPLLDLLTTLLGAILQADLVMAEQTSRIERVSATAETDPLTSLVNRRGWERFIALEEARYHRFGHPGSVMMLDLDGLKEVNDTLGHAAGDRYLCCAAETLRTVLRAGDLVARLGGDEFAVLVANSTPVQTEGLCGRLRAALEEAGVPSSIGHAPYTYAAGFCGAWEAADAAMYADKRARKHDRSAVAV